MATNLTNPNDPIYQQNPGWLRPGETSAQWYARTGTPKATPTPTTPTSPTPPPGGWSSDKYEFSKQMAALPPPITPTSAQGGATPQQPYKVSSGSNLTRSAKAMGITLQQLLDANPEYKANPDFVKAGAMLKYPISSSIAPTSPTPPPGGWSSDKYEFSKQMAAMPPPTTPTGVVQPNLTNPNDPIYQQNPGWLRPGEAKAQWQQRTGTTDAQMTEEHIVPGAGTSATPTPIVPGAGTSATPTPIVPDAGTSAATDTEQPRAQDQAAKDAADKVTADALAKAQTDLAASTTKAQQLTNEALIAKLQAQIDKPFAGPTLVSDREALVSSEGIAGIQTGITNINTEMANLDASYQAGLDKERDALAPMENIGQEQQKMQDNYNRQMNVLTNRKKVLVDEYNLKVSNINSIMELKQVDYANAKQDYDTKFNQSIQLMTAMNTMENTAVDNARANWTAVMGSLQGIDTSKMSGEMKGNIAILEAQMGLPTGISQFVLDNTIPEEEILSSTVIRDNYDNVSGYSVLMKDSDGNFKSKFVSFTGGAIKTGVPTKEEIVSSTVIRDANDNPTGYNVLYRDADGNLKTKVIGFAGGVGGVSTASEKAFQAAASKAFKNVIDDGGIDGSNWGIIWNNLKQQFPYKSNAEIDAALGKVSEDTIDTSTTYMQGMTLYSSDGTALKTFSNQSQADSFAREYGIKSKSQSVRGQTQQATTPSIYTASNYKDAGNGYVMTPDGRMIKKSKIQADMAKHTPKPVSYVTTGQSTKPSALWKWISGLFGGKDLSSMGITKTK